ncbi:UNVERIFIED_CONTAM: hypothetical protein FKN15_051932 [Acipenser sinensis]
MSQTLSGSAVAMTHWLTTVAISDQWGQDRAYKRGRGLGFFSFWQGRGLCKTCPNGTESTGMNFTGNFRRGDRFFPS